MQGNQVILLLTAAVFFSAAAFMLVRLLKMKKSFTKMEIRLDDMDMVNRRLKIAMQYIPYEVMEYNFMNEHLGTIDKKTGYVRDICYEEKQKEADLMSGKTVYPGLKRFIGTMKKRFMQGEDAIEEVLEGYAGSVTKYGKITAKAVYNSLGSPIEAICIIEDVTVPEIERRKAAQQLEQVRNEAKRDPLTGLYNKEGFFAVGQQALDDNKGLTAALIFMDLDNFKNLNDTLGHMTGDRALKDTADKLRDIFPQRDTMARFGGDEFCILTLDNTVSGLRDKLDMITCRMAETYSDGRNSVSVSASVGMAQIPKFGRDIRKVIVLSDKALYCAKERGKNRFVIYEEGMEPEGYTGRRD